MRITDWSSDLCSSDLGRLLCERAALLPEIYHAVVADDLLLDLRVLIGEDDQVVGVRVPGARHQDAVRSQKGAGLGDLLRAGIFLFPLQIGELAVAGDIEPERREPVERDRKGTRLNSR